MSNSEEILDGGIEAKEITKPSEYAFPLELKFKIGTIYNDFTATDSNGKLLAYVRQKIFKFKDHVQVFTDESKKNVAYDIKADKVIDFSAAYGFTDSNNLYMGKVGRKGMKSLWKASYEIFDENNKLEFTIKEENPWAKMMDLLMGEIPVVGIFTGYMFHPKYIVKRPDGTEVARLKKESSFWGHKFSLSKLNEMKEREDDRIILSLTMMCLLERRRG